MKTTRVGKSFAFTMNESDAVFGRALLNATEWHVGNPCQLLSVLPANLDVVTSVLPFGFRASEALNVQITDGARLTLQGDLADLILVASSLKLSINGIGLFVVPQSFLHSQRSVFRQFNTLGLGIVAALALPSGAFAPYTSIPTYLVIVEKKVVEKMFVAQLSTDTNTNLQVIENFRRNQEGTSLELGRFINASSFTGIDVLRVSERLGQAEQRFGYPAVRLGDIAITYTLGRHGDGFSFPKQENSIFVPLIGTSDVIDTLDDATLKPQNYAQIAIDATRSDSRFVARFLNSELGRQIRESSKSGVIPRLNMQSLKGMPVFIPGLNAQREMLALEGRMVVEENTLFGLLNVVSECRQELWANPHSRAELSHRLDVLSLRLSGQLKGQTEQSLEHWFESLPFPMASILRAWLATPSDNFKARYDHLLDFFEAAAEFAAIILLSAFRLREQVFEEIKTDLHAALEKQHLSLKRATFGTWKLVMEHLGKRVRQWLAGNENERATCAAMFSDPSMQLPEVLGNKDLTAVVSRTNKLRNDWKGHGGFVGEQEARARNELLLGEVEKVRNIMGDLWSNIQLVRSTNCRPHPTFFENEVAVLMGSNSEFVRETRRIPQYLYVERLYLVHKRAGHALQLLPLVQVGPSPQSAKNACYFYSRVEKDELRYISYHFEDKNVVKWPAGDFGEVLSLLDENGEI
jgi:hypothetical protein